MRKKCLIIVLVVILLCFAGCSRSSSDIEEYLDTGTSLDSNAKDVMPSLDDLPEYKSIDYKYSHKSIYIFSADSVVLVVNYDDDVYESEKSRLAEKYIYLDEMISADSIDKSKFIISENKFTINSYTFKVVEGNGEDNTDFPKTFGMIGTSDEEKSIAYLYFNDLDLDYIGGTMSEFVKKYFKYDFK